MTTLFPLTSSLRRRAATSPAGPSRPSSCFFVNFIFTFFHSDGVVSVESCQGSSGWPDTLKLLEGPGYQPSYARWHQLSRVYFVIFIRGLHCAAVEETVQGFPIDCKMLLIDRPLLPLYCRCQTRKKIFSKR